MNGKISKLISVLLTVAILCGMMSVSMLSFAADDTVDFTGFEAFARDVSKLVTEENEKNDDALGEDGVSAQSDDSSLCLIVKASGETDDYGAVSKAEGFKDLHVFRYENMAAAEKAYESFKNDGSVEWVEYDMPVSIASVEPTVNEKWLTYDGSKYLSWGADYMGVEAFNEELEGKDCETVTVAVVDTGIDTDHPLFGGFYDEAENPDGRILKNGADFSESEEIIPYEDNQGHGTHVSGTVVDLTPDSVKILPVKALGRNGSASYSQIALGVFYAAQQRADIINMSVGGSTGLDSKVVTYAVETAYESGTLSVVAAGNDYMDAENANPAEIDNCITVGAIDKSLKKCNFSNFGDKIDVVAPGKNIRSANFGGGYVEFSGTSMATPHVAAVAALYLSKDSTLSVSELSDTIIDNAQPVISDEGDDFVYGCGVAFAKPEYYKHLGKITAEYSVERVGEASSTEFVSEKELTLTLKCDGADEIRYTVDGTNPLTSKSAMSYGEPISVKNTSMLRAVALNGSKTPGQSFPYVMKFSIDGTAPTYKLYGDGDVLEAVSGVLPNDFTLPSKYTEIGDYAFAYNEALSKELPITDNVTKIGEGAFVGTYAPEFDLRNVTSVGTLAFAYSEFVTSIKAPKLAHIGDFAFGCMGLIGFFSLFIEEAEFPKVKTIGDYAFYGSAFEELEFPEAVSIGRNAFEGCAFDESFEAPKAEEIGDFAFIMSALSKADFPKAESIGRYTFADTYIQDVSLPLIEEIPEGAFAYSTIEGSVSVPKAKTVGKSAFDYCSLVAIRLPEVETVEDRGFCGAFPADGVDIPKLKTAGDEAFRGICAQEVSFPLLTAVGDKCFECASFVTAELPMLESAGDYAFSGCPLEKLDAPKLKEIGNGAFMSTALTSALIPSAKSIGSMAFFDSWIEAIKLPVSVEYIGTQAFNEGTAIIADTNSYAQNYAKNSEGVRYVSPEEEFTVTFFNAYGREIESKKVKAGDCVTPPKAPFKLFGVFLYWDTDTSCVAEDLTVMPVYESVFHAIYGWFMHIYTSILSFFGFNYIIFY